MGGLGRFGHLGLRRLVPRFSLASLFASSEVGVWYDPSDLFTMWKDTAGTTPVTADGDAVARIDDVSGNGNHASQATSASRPLYKTDGTYHWLQFDGVDDFLETAALSLTAEWSAFAAAKFDDLIGARAVIDTDTRGTDALRHAQMIRRNTSTAESLVFNTAVGTATDAFGTVGTTDPYVMAALRSTTQIEGYLNGVSNGATATSGTPASGTNKLRLGATRDSDISTVQMHSGRIYSAIYIGRVLTSTERSKTERYQANKSGVSL